jgi:tRNA-dihydrouridine synthase B
LKINQIMTTQSGRNNLWKELKCPIKVLAPMAGYTDSAFRLVCRELGADLVMTELISADAVAYAKLEVKKEIIKIGQEKLSFNRVVGKNVATANLLSFFEAERPLIVQLFGKHPDKFAKATAWITKNLKPDGIDINMGCPARKVVGSDHGAALIKYPKLACEIVEAVKSNTHLPVSVKTRLGWDKEDQILEFAPKLYDAGIDAIIIHARTYKNGFKGQAKWKNIYKLKEMMGDKLVIIGNGDIQSVVDDCQSSIDHLDGYAIGRATFGRPWLFCKDQESSEKLKETILRHARLAYETRGEHGILDFRKHLLAYLKGFPGAKKLREEAVSVVDFQDVQELINKL